MPSPLVDQIDQTLRRIEQKTLTQVVDGAQTKDLGDTEVAACGQVLNDSASIQRGMHGSAAAIYVLGETHSSAADAAAFRIIRYSARRDSLESASGAKTRIEVDKLNTIKASELLFALSSLPVALSVPERHALTESLVKLLARGGIAGEWPYFIGSPPSHLLATAFAVRALDKSGSTVPDEAIRRLVAATSPNSNEPSEFSVQVFSLYVLATLQRTSLAQDQKQQVVQNLDAHWRRLSPLLEQDIESNIEYTDPGGDRRYVRVPWQLYLLGAAAQLSPSRHLATRVASERILAIIHGYQANGFHYPHSGTDPSTRTAATVYEVLQYVREALKSAHLRSLWKVVDWVNRLARKRSAIYLARAVALAIAMVAIVGWRHDGGAVADIAPDLLSSALILFLSGGRRGQ